MLIILLVALAVFILIAVVAIIGIVVLSASIGGGIASAVVVQNKKIKQLLFMLFAALALLGLACLAPILAVMVSSEWLAWGQLGAVLLGAISLTLGIVGTTHAIKITHKVAKPVFIVLMILVTLLAVTVAIIAAFTYLVPVFAELRS